MFRNYENQRCTALIQRWFFLKQRCSALLNAEILSSELNGLKEDQSWSAIKQLTSADVFHVIWISGDKRQISETALLSSDYLWDVNPGSFCETFCQKTWEIFVIQTFYQCKAVPRAWLEPLFSEMRLQKHMEDITGQRSFSSFFRWIFGYKKPLIKFFFNIFFPITWLSIIVFEYTGTKPPFKNQVSMRLSRFKKSFRFLHFDSCWVFTFPNFFPQFRHSLAAWPSQSKLSASQVSHNYQLQSQGLLIVI